MPLTQLLVPVKVNLAAELPSVVREPAFVVAGTTHPNAIVRPVVDTTVFDGTMAEADGTFSVNVPLLEIGTHDVRIEVRYGSLAEPPAELAMGQVTRVGAALPPPRLLAVEPDPQGAVGAYRLLVATTPGTNVMADGASLTLDTTTWAQQWGRLTYTAKPLDPTTPRVRLSADAGGGLESVQTPEFDLAALAASGVIQEEQDSTDTTIVYDIDRFGISRSQSVALAPNRPELTELTVGRLDTFGFLQTVAGQAGLAPGPGQSCDIARYGSALPDVEIGSRATVTFRDMFPDFITNTNGFADRPELTLCFPDGLPTFGNEGHLEVRISDYAVVATNPRPTSAAIERPDTGPLVRVYRWDRLPVGGRVDLTLAVDVQTALGLIPKARIGNVITDPELGALLSGVVYALVQAAGLLLLLWLTASSQGRAQFKEPARTAASDILTLGVAFAFLPAVAQASSLLGYRAFTLFRLPLDPLAQELRQPPDVVGSCALDLVILVGAFVVARRIRNRLLWSRLAAALTIAVALWLFVLVAGRLTIAGAKGLGSGSSAQSAVAAWVVAAALVLLAIAYGRWRFSPLGYALTRLDRGAQTPVLVRRGGRLRVWSARLRLPRRTSRLALVAVVGSAVLAAIAMGFPVGRRTPTPEALGSAEALFDFVISQFVGLLAYGYALFGLAAVVILIRDAWFRVPWDDLIPLAGGTGSDGRDREDSEQHLRRTGRAIFAGFVIGTAGVFAVLPLPFFIAFPLFDRLLLRPSTEIATLAREAPTIRAEREGFLAASIRKGLAPDNDEASVPSQEVDRQSEFQVDNVAALGPEDTVWANVALGLKVGAALTASLLVLYLGFYPFASVTTEDPYYLQRLGLNIVAFAGSWLIIGFFFGLMYEHLRGESGLQKGLWLGGAILVLTLPFQLLSTLASGLPLTAITIRVLQVLAFTALLGGAFDLRLMRRLGRLRIGRPRRLLADLGGMSGSSQVATAVLFIVASVVGTVGTLVTGQLAQLVTRILTPFLPLPT